MANSKLKKQLVESIHDGSFVTREELNKLPLFWLIVFEIGSRHLAQNIKHPERLDSLRNTPFHKEAQWSMAVWSRFAQDQLGNDSLKLYRNHLAHVNSFAIEPIGFEIARALNLSTIDGCRIGLLKSLEDPRFWPQAAHLSQYNTRDQIFYSSIAEGGDDWWDVLTGSIQPLSAENCREISNAQRAFSSRDKALSTKDVLVEYWLSHVLWRKSYNEILISLGKKIFCGANHDSDIDRIKKAIYRLPLKHDPPG